MSYRDLLVAIHATEDGRPDDYFDALERVLILRLRDALKRHPVQQTTSLIVAGRAFKEMDDISDLPLVQVGWLDMERAERAVALSLYRYEWDKRLVAKRLGVTVRRVEEIRFSVLEKMRAAFAGDPLIEQLAAQFPLEKAVRDYISKELRAAVYFRDGYACRGCGVTENLTLDHVLAVRRGGPSTYENLQVLCRRCNSSKHTALAIP